MLCPSCSTAVPAGSTFCPKCGQRLTGGAAGSGSATPAQQLRAKQSAATSGDQTETHLWKGSYSPKAMFGSWLFAGIVTIAAIAVCVLVPNPIAWMVAGVLVPVLWLSLAGYLLYQRLAVEYDLSTQRFMHKTGVLRRVTNRIEVIDIDDVTYEQGFIERMFGVGTIKMLSSDTSHPNLVLRGIDNVQHVANLIDNARRDERRKRGLYMESV